MVFIFVVPLGSLVFPFLGVLNISKLSVFTAGMCFVINRYFIKALISDHSDVDFMFVSYHCHSLLSVDKIDHIVRVICLQIRMYINLRLYRDS